MLLKAKCLKFILDVKKVTFANEKVATREGRKYRYTFAGASYFMRMQDLGLYTTDI